MQACKPWTAIALRHPNPDCLSGPTSQPSCIPDTAKPSLTDRFGARSDSVSPVQAGEPYNMLTSTLSYVGNSRSRVSRMSLSVASMGVMK